MVQQPTHAVNSPRSPAAPDDPRPPRAATSPWRNRLDWFWITAAYLLIAFALLWPASRGSHNGLLLWLGWFAFLTRTFLFLGALAVLRVMFGLAWRRRWRLAAVLTPALLITAGPWLWTFLPRAAPTIAADAARLRVMSVNLLGDNRQHGAMAAEILAADADVVLLQEYMDDWQVDLMKALAEKYPYHLHAPRADFFGMAIYSRLPFVQETAANLPIADTPQMRVVVEISGHRVALYNLHLAPPARAWAFRRQCREFHKLLGLLRDEPLPALLTGDFNFTNDSFFADQLAAAGFADVHALIGSGPGATWPDIRRTGNVALIRLDHIYASPHWQAIATRLGVGPGSDHRPIVADLALSPPH